MKEVEMEKLVEKEKKTTDDNNGTVVVEKKEDTNKVIITSAAATPIIKSNTEMKEGGGIKASGEVEEPAEKNNKDTTTTTTTTTSNNTMKDTTTNKKKEDKNGTTLEEKTNTTHSNYDLVIREKYLCNGRPASLGPLPICKIDNNDRRHNKGKYKKKRPRDKRIPNSEKMCLSTLRGEECPKGDECTYSHDVEAYLKTRPPDLPITCPLADTTTSDTTIYCPSFRNTGFCRFGVTCRVGSCHITSKGENIINNKDNTNPPTVLNSIDHDMFKLLRKKQYNFKCPRNPGSKECKTNDKANEFYNFFNVIDYPSLKEKKKVDFENKIYVAPLTTVGNLPFRRIMKEYGADITCGEMAVVQHLLEGSKSEWSLLKRHSSEDVFGIQLTTGYHDHMARFCEVLTNENISMDFVDLNLGCPLDLICKRYQAGANLMLQQSENKLRQIVTGMINTLNCPITIKMRTGWDNNRPVAHSLIRSVTEKWNINHSVCSAIMVHGRSRLQRYSKTANWDYIYNDACTVQQQPSSAIPIIGNGDIYSYQDYKAQVENRINNDDKTTTTNNALSKTAMLGRGALIKPWLPQDIKEHRTNYDISSSERFDILQKFTCHGLEHWGSDTLGVNLTRRFMLEWLSFLHRYIPVGLLPEGAEPPKLNQRPPTFIEGRNELETLMLSPHSHDWIQLTEKLLGKVPDDFQFEPKHKATSYQNRATNNNNASRSNNDKQDSW